MIYREEYIIRDKGSFFSTIQLHTHAYIRYTFRTHTHTHMHITHTQRTRTRTDNGDSIDEKKREKLHRSVDWDLRV